MTASYPESIVSFTTKFDFINAVLAAHVNLLQAEVTAIESALGTLPQGEVSATVADRLTAIQSSLAAVGDMFVEGQLPQSGVTDLVSTLTTINESITALTTTVAGAVLLAGAQTLTGAKRFAPGSGVVGGAVGPPAVLSYFIIANEGGTDYKYLRGNGSAFEIVDSNPTDPTEAALFSYDSSDGPSVAQPFNPQQGYTSWFNISGVQAFYLKDATGVVHIAGSIPALISGSSPVLPAGFRPLKTHGFTGVNNAGGLLLFTIGTDGTLHVLAGNGTASESYTVGTSFYTG